MNDSTVRFDESADDQPVYEIEDDGTTLQEAADDAADAVDNDQE